MDAVQCIPEFCCLLRCLLQVALKNAVLLDIPLARCWFPCAANVEVRKVGLDQVAEHDVEALALRCTLDRFGDFGGSPV